MGRAARFSGVAVLSLVLAGAVAGCKKEPAKRFIMLSLSDLSPGLTRAKMEASCAAGRGLFFPADAGPDREQQAAAGAARRPRVRLTSLRAP